MSTTSVNNRAQIAGADDREVVPTGFRNNGKLRPVCLPASLCALNFARKRL
jgi:hypothetical protein